LLPKLNHVERRADLDVKADVDIMIVFLGEFGAYIEINKCLLYAAALHTEVVIDLLLGIAKNDPRHREVVKLMSKANHLMPYEQVCIYPNPE
jgi:hypothetical protein